MNADKFKIFAYHATVVFVAAVAGAISATSRGLTEFSLVEWMHVLDAGLAAVVLMLIAVLTPVTRAYGVGNDTL